MASRTIVILLYKFRLLQSLNIHYPNPHKFYSISLQSGLWDTIPFNKLIEERKNRMILYNNKKRLYKEVYDDCIKGKKELKVFF